VTVLIHGEPFVIVDVGMRMLTPRELATAQGFRRSYVIDRTIDGREVPRTRQVKMIGNSVARIRIAHCFGPTFRESFITRPRHKLHQSRATPAGVSWPLWVDAERISRNVLEMSVNLSHFYEEPTIVTEVSKLASYVKYVVIRIWEFG
jgi:hypothetical protein